jgi:hypothetical protein
MFAGSGYRGKSDSSLSLPIRRIQLLFSVMIETILEGVKTKGGDGWLVVSWVEATIADFGSKDAPRCAVVVKEGFPGRRIATLSRSLCKGVK